MRIVVYMYIQIVALAANESGRILGRIELSISDDCTLSAKCRWTDIRICYDDGCLFVSDTCNNMDYSDDSSNGTKAGNQAALAFNIFGLLLLTVAIMVIFTKSIQDEIGKYIRSMVGLSALCALNAIISMATGNFENECWNDDPSIDFYQFEITAAGPGITFYVQIAVFVLLIVATALIHPKEYVAAGTTNLS